MSTDFLDLPPTFGRRRLVSDNYSSRYFVTGSGDLSGKLWSRRPRRDLQSKKPFNSDVLCQLEQCIEPLVLPQQFAVDFHFEC